MSGGIQDAVPFAVVTSPAVPSAGYKSAKMEVDAITTFSLVLLGHGLSLHHLLAKGGGGNALARCRLTVSLHRLSPFLRV